MRKVGTFCLCRVVSASFQDTQRRVVYRSKSHKEEKKQKEAMALRAICEVGPNGVSCDGSADTGKYVLF
jgi:thiamine monophosphate synthase